MNLIHLMKCVLYNRNICQFFVRHPFVRIVKAYSFVCNF